MICNREGVGWTRWVIQDAVTSPSGKGALSPLASPWACDFSGDHNSGRSCLCNGLSLNFEKEGATLPWARIPVTPPMHICSTEWLDLWRGAELEAIMGVLVGKNPSSCRPV